jgi:hypothetical protein
MRHETSVTQRGAPKLYGARALREGSRMLFIAVGLVVVLVGADLLDVRSTKSSRRQADRL